MLENAGSGLQPEPKRFGSIENDRSSQKGWEWVGRGNS